MTDDPRLKLLDWATATTRDYVQGIGDSNQGVSKDALRSAGAALAAIGPSTDADATADEIQAVRRDLDAKTRHLRGASRNASANSLVAIETCWRLCIASSVPSGSRATALAADLARAVGLDESVIDAIAGGTSPSEAMAAAGAE